MPTIAGEFVKRAMMFRLSLERILFYLEPRNPQDEKLA